MDFAQDKQERANNFGKAPRRFRVEWPNNGTNRRHRRTACFQASSAERKPPLGDKTCQTKFPSRAALCQPDESDSGDRIAKRRRMDYEVKWDGYRALGLKHNQNPRLLSRKDKDLTSDFPAVAEAVCSIHAGTASIDGEIVAVDSNGCPSFQALQNRASLRRDWQIVYYAFDLLNFEGQDWTKKPLAERKEKLRKILEGSDVRYNANLSGSPKQILRTIESAGLEGIVAKKRNSLYRAGTRVTTWLKFKINRSQELVIGGYKPDAASFQSVLVGYYEAKKLLFAGKVRQGFNPMCARSYSQQCGHT